MPIDTFGFPMPQAFSGGADFAPLANLGNVYQQGQDRQRMLATLGQMGNDPTQNAMLMIKSQNPEMVQQGLHLMNQITEQKRYADAQAERQREFEITNKLAQSKEQREVEAAQAATPTGRAQALKEAGYDINDPNLEPEQKAALVAHIQT